MEAAVAVAGAAAVGCRCKVVRVALGAALVSRRFTLDDCFTGAPHSSARTTSWIYAGGGGGARVTGRGLWV